MAEKAGLFAWIRSTSFLKFVLAWVIGIFIFMIFYFTLSTIHPGLAISGSNITTGYLGFVESLYASLLIATIFGIGQISAQAPYTLIVYLQLIFSGIVILILIDKLLQKYVFPHYHIHHTQDKKINTMILTMSIFRNDIERIKHDFRAKTKHHVDVKEIEGTIDGLYVTFLDIDKMFSVKNVHKHVITDHQYLMVVTNIEDSLHKLDRFIAFLDEHKISWKDKSVEFWIRYILETADRITMHFDDVKLKNPKLIIAIENIKELTQAIERKL